MMHLVFLVGLAELTARTMFTDGSLMNALMACETGRDAALAKAGIRP